MRRSKDRRLWWALSLIYTLGLISLALSVSGFDKAGLILGGVAVLCAIAGVAFTALDVARSPNIHVRGPKTKHP